MKGNEILNLKRFKKSKFHLNTNGSVEIELSKKYRCTKKCFDMLVKLSNFNLNVTVYVQWFCYTLPSYVKSLSLVEEDKKIGIGLYF